MHLRRPFKDCKGVCSVYLDLPCSAARAPVALSERLAQQQAQQSGPHTQPQDRWSSSLARSRIVPVRAIKAVLAYLCFQSSLTRLALLIRRQCSGPVALTPANIISTQLPQTAHHWCYNGCGTPSLGLSVVKGCTCCLRFCQRSTVDQQATAYLYATASSAVWNLYLGLAPRVFFRCPSSMPLTWFDRAPPIWACISPAQSNNASWFVSPHLGI